MEPTAFEETVTDAFDDVPDSAVIAIRNKGCELHRSMWAPANFKARSVTAESTRDKFAQTCAQRGIKIQSPKTPKEVVQLSGSSEKEDKDVVQVSEPSTNNEKGVVLPVSEPSNYNKIRMEAPLGVMVKYVTERNTLETDGKVDFQSKALTKGAPPKYVTSRHNSGVIVRAIFDVAGGITGGGPRGDMKWLAFKKGDELSIKKMLGNGW
jgi:hypothetical protein